MVYRSVRVVKDFQRAVILIDSSKFFAFRISKRACTSIIRNSFNIMKIAFDDTIERNMEDQQIGWQPTSEFSSVVHTRDKRLLLLLQLV